MFLSRSMTGIGRTNRSLLRLSNFKCPNRNVKRFICISKRFSSDTMNDEIVISDVLPNSNSQVTFTSLLKILEKFSEGQQLPQEQVILFLQCCGNLSIYQSPHQKSAALHKLWKLLEKNGFQFSIEHYKIYIQVCTENAVIIECNEFLSTMKCEAHLDIYKLLLQNVCEKGDLEQAFFLLSLMKDKRHAVDEETFSYLMLAESINSGVKGGESVFQMMKSAQIPISENIKMSLIRGVIKGRHHGELKDALERYPVKFDEQQFLKVLEDLCLNEKHHWLPELLKKISSEEFSRSFFKGLELLCIQLIHCGKCSPAIYIYKGMIKPSGESEYAKELIEQMVKVGMSASAILEVVKDLRQSGLNSLALENATEFALREQRSELAWKLFENFTYLRPHFFWPLLRSGGLRGGETEVLVILQKMFDSGVKADMETLEQYCLPFCNLSEPKLLIKKLQDIGYTVKSVLTPVLLVLILQQELETARNLCQLYNVEIFSERLIPALVNAWRNVDNIEAIVQILQRTCETSLTNLQWFETFLVRIFLSAKCEDIEKLILTLKNLCSKKLYIKPFTADNLINITSKKFLDEPLFNDLRDAIDAVQDVSITDEPTELPHPRDMTVDQLECHLLELENKNMETRGVLRMLIQKYSNTGNTTRVQELREKVNAKAYTESPGMKASVMHSYVRARDLSSALDLYHEVNLLNPRFKVDSFKIVDLATLLVEENKAGEALKVLEDEGKKGSIKSGRTLEGNCLKLLRAVQTPEDLQMIFETLMRYGYCRASNVILGPLVRIHLKTANLEQAVQVYVDCTKNYKSTPLQLELLCSLLKVRNVDLFERAVAATQTVHGKRGASAAVVFALAEEGMTDGLKKFLTNSPSLPSKEFFRKRYDRWIEERKMVPLVTIGAVLRKLQVENLDLPYVHLSIMRIYSLANDCEGALGFWEELISEKVFVTREVTAALYNLLIKNNFDIPKSLEVQV